MSLSALLEVLPPPSTPLETGDTGRCQNCRTFYPYPCPLFPALGGLLPFGITGSGDRLFWKTTGGPDKWTIFVRDARAPLYDEYPMSLTEYRSSLIKNDITGKVFPPNVLDHNHLFTTNPVYSG